MKVLIISPAVYQLPCGGYGGIEMLLFFYAQKLAKVSPNVEVSVAAPRWSHIPGCKEVIQTIDLQSHPEHAWREDLAYKMYHKRLDEFDVIHDFSHRKIASRLRVLPALHMLWHAYGNYPEPKYNLIGLSKWHAQQMKDQYKQEVKAVHMGVDVDLYKPSGKPVGDYFLFIGQPSPTKGCAQAIEYCVKTHQKLHIICGQVPNELQPNKERLQQMCDQKNIVWLGEVSNEVKINELCSARALLHPEQQDAGSSLVAMEAIACGTPTIVPNRCAYPEIIDNESGVCCKSEPEYLAILANKGMLESFDRKKIRERAVKLFSLNTMVNSYMSLYDQVRKGENWV